MKITLSNEQAIAFEKYQNGENVFMTGPGGAGKSVLIREIYYNAIRNKRKIGVCALTGCAAVLLKCRARTIHSWGGLGRCAGPTEEIINRITEHKFKKRNWLQTDVLVVDEVSMMSKKLFELCDAIAKKVRGNNLPFGGMQIVFSGDFYQLPPVGEKEEPETSQFCFESELWDSTFRGNNILLKKLFRQEGDMVYGEILNQVRQGKLKRKAHDLLTQQVNKNPEDSCEVRPTKLFPRKADVDRVNNEEMEKIEGESYIYAFERVKDLCKPSRNYSSAELEYEYDYLRSSIPGEAEVLMRVGAQVMCVVNMEDAQLGYTLCNGSQGKVIGFSDKQMPIVKFNGISTPITMTFNTWASESIPSIGIKHMPLVLAWAMTIHKSQGTTLEIAEIDVGDRVFECGQTYVALSRVKSLEGLYLTNFNYQKVYTNKKVKTFYSTISDATLESEELEK